MARVVGWAVGGGIVAAAVIALDFWIADLLDAERPWVAILVGAASGALAAALAAARHKAPGAQLSRSTVVAGVLLLALVVAGLALWLPGGDGAGTKDTDLGTALLGGAVVAGAVLFLQRRLDAEWRRLDADRAAEDERRRLRDQAQMLCAMVNDLTGVDFSDRDLRDMFLRNKVLAEANLEGSVLWRAVLTGADLTGAVLRGADLVGAQAKDAIFRGATLVDAKLGDALLEGADLRGCDLVGAELGGARLKGAKYGKSGKDQTHWPAGFNVDASGAVAC
jgi:hypothetical protein